ncbi:MAG: amino acid racemase [Armatimonadota bacterium]|nr:amino acid racemase [Armatimonadota bacterium]MDR7438839.1 amino acid racemase [Armatimonadota bacterium]MDR7563965.1 amino acid racemase [Armatimonadota bacterium]MDR7602213.1 amino acid racemase [Armatimonadota bacterium]
MALTVGVLGGMGPRATADFFWKLIELTPAQRDQDHLRVLIESNPWIPDRSAFILGEGEDPTPWLVEAARRLEVAGADFLVIPCNTAHYFLQAIRDSVGIPVLDITEAVVEAAVREVPGLVTAGLLATTATVHTRLYHRTFARWEVQVVVPEREEQEVVDRAIYSVKAGDLGPGVREDVRRVGLGLVARGAQAIVLGCTEIPLVVDPEEWPVPVLDSTLALARTTVRTALSTWREEDESMARSQKGR